MSCCGSYIDNIYCVCNCAVHTCGQGFCKALVAASSLKAYSGLLNGVLCHWRALLKAKLNRDFATLFSPNAKTILIFYCNALQPVKSLNEIKSRAFLVKYLH